MMLCISVTVAGAVPVLAADIFNKRKTGQETHKEAPLEAPKGKAGIFVPLQNFKEKVYSYSKKKIPGAAKKKTPAGELDPRLLTVAGEDPQSTEELVRIAEILRAPAMADLNDMQANLQKAWEAKEKAMARQAEKNAIMQAEALKKQPKIPGRMLTKPIYDESGLKRIDQKEESRAANVPVMRGGKVGTRKEEKPHRKGPPKVFIDNSRADDRDNQQ